MTEPFPLLSYLLPFEGGTLSPEDTLVLFQHLIDTDLAWLLQGTYGRTAVDLIEAGLCHPKRDTIEDVCDALTPSDACPDCGAPEGRMCRGWSLRFRD